MTVTYNANGGKGTVPSTVGPLGSAVTLPKGSALTKSGYGFVGWNTRADGKGTTYDAGASYTLPYPGATLYAKWGRLPATPKKPIARAADKGQAKIIVRPGSGGGAAESYVVKAAPGGAKCTVLATAKPLSCTISGLNPKRTYTFTATAKNKAGISSRSPKSAVAGAVEAARRPATASLHCDCAGGE